MAKKNYVRDTFASCKDKDTFGSIYESMVLSPAFIELSSREKVMYMLCRVQASSKTAKSCIYNHATENEREYEKNAFVFPAKHMAKYGIDRSNGNKLLKQLEEKGFIEKVECNKRQRKINVYRFSIGWKNSS